MSTKTPPARQPQPAADSERESQRAAAAALESFLRRKPLTPTDRIVGGLLAALQESVALCEQLRDSTDCDCGTRDELGVYKNRCEACDCRLEVDGTLYMLNLVEGTFAGAAGWHANNHARQLGYRRNGRKKAVAV